MPIKFLNEINNFTIKGESGVSTLDLDGSEFDAVLIKAGLAELIEYDTQDNLIDIGSYNGSNPIISGNPGTNVSLMYTSSEALRTIPNGIYIPNRIGIGTTSPSQKLHVNGRARVDVAADNVWMDLINSSESAFRLRTYNNGTNEGNSVYAFKHGLYYNGIENAAVTFYRGGSTIGGFLTFTTNNGTERMRIASDGNVGIGTTSPSQKLDVVGNGLFGNGNTPITLQVGEATGYTSQTNSTLKLAQGGGNYHEFRGLRSSGSEGSMYIMEEYTDNNELVRKTNSYDGDTSHILYGYPLSLQGNPTNIYNVDYMEIRQYIDHDNDNDTRFGFPGTNTFAIDTNGSERMRINSSGNVGIGTTSPSSILSISNNAPVITAISTNNSSGLRYNVAGTAQTAHRFQYGGSTKMTIRNNGNVGIGIENPTSTLAVTGEIDVAGGDGYRIDGKPWAQFSTDLLTLGDFDGEGYATRIMDSDSSEAIRIINSGKVGIGTTSPTEKLEVEGGNIPVSYTHLTLPTICSV